MKSSNLCRWECVVELLSRVGFPLLELFDEGGLRDRLDTREVYFGKQVVLTPGKADDNTLYVYLTILTKRQVSAWLCLMLSAGDCGTTRSGLGN